MTALGYLTLFFIFASANLAANVGAGYINYRLQKRAMLRQQSAALAAFRSAMDEDCGDENCPVHGAGAKQEAVALKN